MSFYRELFSEEEASPGSAFHDILATCIYDIYPEELYETLIDCIDRGLVDTSVIDKADLSRYMEKGKETILKQLQADTRCDFIYDVIAELEWWACFQPEKSEKPPERGCPKIPQSPEPQNFGDALCPTPHFSKFCFLERTSDPRRQPARAPYSHSRGTHNF